MNAVSKCLFLCVAGALAASLPITSPAAAWSCSSEEPLATPLPLEERTRVAAEVERERDAATARSDVELDRKTSPVPRTALPTAGLPDQAPTRTSPQ
jgi:hypothetical protein